MKKHTVPPLRGPLPLSRYLERAFPRIPPWLLRDTLKKKDVRVNGIKSGPETLLNGGEELTIYLRDEYLDAPLKILYEDEDMMAVEKPAGIPVDADADNIGADTMQRRLSAHCPTARLAHRLDTGTGGVLLASRTEAGHARLLDAFRNHEIRKFYRCLALGCPSPREATLKAYLAKDASAARVRVTDHPIPGALPIETRYRVVATAGEVCELEVELITGRTHQIRAHLAHIGHPLLGDDKYGDRAFNRRHHAQNPQLWCVRMEYRSLRVESPAPFSLPE